MSRIIVGVLDGFVGQIPSAETISIFTVILWSWIHQKSIAAPPAVWPFRGNDLVESLWSRRPLTRPGCARVVAVTVMPAALLLSSCHGTGAHGTATHPAQSDEPHITGEPATHNNHDISFGDSMIAYDEQETDMSALVPDRSVNPKVIAFAAKNAAALRTDVVTLRALTVQWDQDQGSIPGGGQGMAIQGLVDPATFAKLQSLRDKSFDSLWLQSMIGLDQKAIEASRIEIAGGQNVDFIGLARQILDARQADTRLLGQMLNDTG